MSDKELKDMTVEEIEALIKETIDNAPEEYKQSALRIQFKYEAIRARYKDNPVGAMLATNKLMLQSSRKLTEKLRELTSHDFRED
jgi:hypothetical protein